jgi:hypothetical protein
VIVSSEITPPGALGAFAWRGADGLGLGPGRVLNVEVPATIKIVCTGLILQVLRDLVLYHRSTYRTGANFKVPVTALPSAHACPDA